MGGLIGMVLAASPICRCRCAIRRLVLNDVGPVIRWEALERIGTYLGQTGRFSVGAAGRRRDVGDIRPDSVRTRREQWLELSRPMVKPVAGDEGAFTLHYDPAIAVPFRTLTRESAAQGEALLWKLYDAHHAPRPCCCAAPSRTCCRARPRRPWRTRGPKARLVEFAGVGHAPTLIAEDQVDCGDGFPAAR